MREYDRHMDLLRIQQSAQSQNQYGQGLAGLAGSSGLYSGSAYGQTPHIECAQKVKKERTLREQLQKETDEWLGC